MGVVNSRPFESTGRPRTLRCVASRDLKEKENLDEFLLCLKCCIDFNMFTVNTIKVNVLFLMNYDGKIVVWYFERSKHFNFVILELCDSSLFKNVEISLDDQCKRRVLIFRLGTFGSILVQSYKNRSQPGLISSKSDL